ncbi:MAG: S-formylglutathione hydrolase [Cyanobacteria bacterium P01_H01_bin.15]
MAGTLELEKQHRCFGGTLSYYRHFSDCCQGSMQFTLYLPPQAKDKSVPLLWYLSGLTCTAENFTVKAGAQRLAAEYDFAIAAPDTSPRNTGIPGEDESWDLGSGAGFYVDATVEPWSSHYQMYSYVTQELPTLVIENFPLDADKQSIFGHSMGGHGALVCALRNPKKYQSVSAFAPIAAPSQTTWGQNAFKAYLGDDTKFWAAYDAAELLNTQTLESEILIDQGTADSFYQDGGLLPEKFAEVCEQAGQKIKLRLQDGYDHSYFFVSTFIQDHFQHHAQYLQ